MSRPTLLLALLSPDPLGSAVRASPRQATSASSFLPSEKVTARGESSRNTWAKSKGSSERRVQQGSGPLRDPQPPARDVRAGASQPVPGPQSLPQLTCKRPSLLEARVFPSVTLSFAVRRESARPWCQRERAGALEQVGVERRAVTRPGPGTLAPRALP